MENKYDLSIVIPCYNEFSLLRDSVKEIAKVMNQIKYSYELIFVDDKSVDGTQKIIEEIAYRKENMKYIFHSENTGRGEPLNTTKLFSPAINIT